jgi:excisionase family DNA binding protein
MDNYYTVDNLMQIFGVSRLTILKKIKNNEIKATKIANMRRWYIPKEQFNYKTDKNNEKRKNHICEKNKNEKEN